MENFDSQLYRYCTRGKKLLNTANNFLGSNSPNFALLFITKNPNEIDNTASIAYRIHQIFVFECYTVIDDLALLLYILNGNIESYKQFYATNANKMCIDFGGFNNELVDEKYKQRQV